MIKKGLDTLLSRFENSRLYPLVEAMDTFLHEIGTKTKSRPYIRDGIDIKRWMILVVISLLPCTFMAIWNSGLQAYVYGSSDYALVQEYFSASSSFSSYLSFIYKDYRFLYILKEGAFIFIPILIISYAVGGFWEVIFACTRKHPINEGLLVTGLLYPLTLPATIPYWMVAVGISFGIVVGKEIFGGTGMNILNPALTSRTFLFFAFPAYMTGSIWVGGDPVQVERSITQMNQQAEYDAVSQETYLSRFNLPHEVKKIHTDAIEAYKYNLNVPTYPYIIQKLETFSGQTKLSELSEDEFDSFVTSPTSKSGLGLLADNFSAAKEFVKLKIGIPPYTSKNMFFGNRIGSMGETSILACLIGAFILVITGIGSWRTMFAFALGVFVVAGIFSFSPLLSSFSGAKIPAIFDFPVYKQYLIGSIAFGLVFMATDPVSSPTMSLGKYIYGFLIGGLVIVIRLINPAYPEGVMLGILFGNVFSPLIDYYSVRFFRRKRRAV